LKKNLLIISLLLILASNGAYAFCFAEASREFGISSQLLWAIAKKESCLNPAAVNRNANGSYDYGVLPVSLREKIPPIR
jgi:soluble lytic murein transglycosylase-like protein